MHEKKERGENGKKRGASSFALSFSFSALSLLSLQMRRRKPQSSGVSRSTTTVQLQEENKISYLIQVFSVRNCSARCYDCGVIAPCVKEGKSLLTRQQGEFYWPAFLFRNNLVRPGQGIK